LLRYLRDVVTAVTMGFEPSTLYFLSYRQFTDCGHARSQSAVSRPEGLTFPMGVVLIVFNRGYTNDGGEMGSNIAICRR